MFSVPDDTEVFEMKGVAPVSDPASETAVKPAQSAAPAAISTRDSLVSIAVIAGGKTDEVEGVVRRAAAYLEDTFEFFEILVVVGASEFDRHQASYEALLDIRNARCLVLRDGIGDYRAAVIAATESIGDLVLILQSEEAGMLDLGTVFEAALSHGGSVVLRRMQQAGAVAGVLGSLLSRVSGYDVDPRFLRSAVHSRAHIGRISSRADRDIALRFAPMAGTGGAEVRILDVGEGGGVGRRVSTLSRLGNAMDVMANSPPHLLRFLAAASFVVSFGAVAYFIYAIVLFLAGADLQPGWLTTSVAISGSTAFIALALGGISTALYQILNLLRDETGDEILREVNNTDLFREFRRVNVETIGKD